MTDEKIYQLIIKLIRDTNDKRILWTCIDSNDSFDAFVNIGNYEISFKTSFSTFLKHGDTTFAFKLTDTNDQKVLLNLSEDFNAVLFNDLYEAIQKHTGNNKLETAIEQILNY
jgi:hypothetical protein